MRILVIEDQKKIATLIKRGLEKEGYAVDVVEDGEAGQERLEMHNSDYDVVLLDLMLPKRDGFEVCKNIREEHIKVPILVLTARSGVEDKVNLLNLGADDYLIKPFEFKELLARIRALTRRPVTLLPTELKADNLVLNPTAKTVHFQGKEIKMSLTEFRLLEYLMRHPNEAVAREDLFNNVWDFNSDSFSNIIDVYINRLRSKLQKSPSEESIIITVRGIGYKLVKAAA